MEKTAFFAVSILLLVLCYTLLFNFKQMFVKPNSQLLKFTMAGLILKNMAVQSADCCLLLEISGVNVLKCCCVQLTRVLIWHNHYTYLIRQCAF